jgi:hypothetical protein
VSVDVSKQGGVGKREEKARMIWQLGYSDTYMAFMVGTIEVHTIPARREE